MKNGQVHEGGKVGRSSATPTKLFSVDSFDLKSLSSLLLLKCEGHTSGLELVQVPRVPGTHGILDSTVRHPMILAILLQNVVFNP